MSFDQLPDELVLLVAGHFVHPDQITLMKTQKRIRDLLKRNGLDKPAVYSLKFEFINEPPDRNEAYCYRGNANGKTHLIIRERELYDTKQDFIASACYKFRSFNKLTLTCNAGDMFTVRDLSNWTSLVEEKKIKDFEIKTVTIECATEAFVAFCIKLNKLKLVECLIEEEIISDTILCKILPTTNLDLRHIYFPRRFLPDVTDLTIDAMIGGKLPKNFGLSHWTTTKFTIAAIRRLTKHCCKTGLHFDISLGRVNEAEAARQWYIFVRDADNLPYELKIDTDNDVMGGTKLEIVKREWTAVKDAQRSKITVYIPGLRALL